MVTTRYLWNKVLARVNDEKLEKNFFQLRNKFVIAKDNPEVEDFEKQTPKDVRAGTVKDLVTSFKSAFSNLKNGNIAKFKIGFKSKKQCPFPTITIPKNAISFKNRNLKIYPTFLGGNFKHGERKNTWMKETLDCDCKLALQNGKWFLIVPCKLKAVESFESESIVALDPGKRSFMTGFSEEKIFKCIPNFDKIKKLQERLNLFQSLKDKNHISKRKWKFRREKLYSKLNSLIDELHYKTIRILETYETILLPSFESQEMVRKSRNRNLNRSLLQLKHFLFQTRLKERCGKRVKICTEEFTSKTCGRCGEINDVRNKEILKCVGCNLEVDRDLNAARNIYLKFFYGS